MHPILLTLPNGAPMYAYGAALGFALFVGLVVARALVREDGLSEREAVLWFLATALPALVASKLLFVLTNLDRVRSPADLVSGRGLVAYGGFLGAFVGGAAWGRWRGRPIGVWADAAAAATCLGLAIVRVGCLCAGCDFGTPSSGPLAIHFPPGSPAYVEQRAAGLLAAGAPTSLGVHPTQVYESLAGVVLFVLVLAARARRRRPGEAYVAFIVGYAVFRFAVEFVRGDAGRGALGPFSTSQWLALATATAAATWFVRMRAVGGAGVREEPRPRRT